MPFFSVIVTCYNYGRYIEDALKSLAEQTCQDFEIIIVDDGSTEQETVDKLCSLKAKGYNVISRPNGGPSAARNTGIAAAVGTFIVCLDADDCFVPGFLAEAKKVLSNNPDRLVYSDVIYFGDRHGVVEYSAFDPVRMCVSNQIPVFAAFHKKFWSRESGWSSEFDGLEDYDFWLTVLEKGGVPHKLPQPQLFYRQHKDITSVRHRLAKKEQLKKLYGKIMQKHCGYFMQHAEELHEILLDGLKRRRARAVLNFRIRKYRIRLEITKQGGPVKKSRYKQA